MKNYDREPLDEFEEVRGVFYGGYGQVGQQFVITNRRLLMAPIKLVKGISDKVALEAAGWIAGQLNVPGADIVKSILVDYGPFNPQTVWLRHIVSVESGSNGGLFQPPKLVFTTDTEDTETIGVVHKWNAPNISGKNKPARDEMVAVLRQAVADAKKAPTPSP
jgi:hypothetical protein